MEILSGHLKEKEVILACNTKGRTFIELFFLGIQYTASNIPYLAGRLGKCLQPNPAVITCASFPLK